MILPPMPRFPRHGKFFGPFSTPWKIFIHPWTTFPRHGKFPSTDGKFFHRWTTFIHRWMAPAAALFLLLSPAPSSAESPFRLSAVRARFDGAPAVRIDFSIPPEHKLYAGFSVADPAGNPLPPLSVSSSRKRSPEPSAEGR